MISKILCIALLVACSQAIQYDNHQATSSVSFNQHHNTVHHIQSAPALVKTVAAPVHAVPITIKSTAPIYSAPHSQPSSYAHYTAPIASSLSFAQHAAPAAHYATPAVHYAAPAVHYAAPVAKVAAPAHHASSYSSLSIGHSAPAAHHVAPVTSISKIVASPAIHAAPAIHFAPSVHSAPAVHAAPAVYSSGHHQEEYAHPKYEFAYGVEDHHTGDIHSHKEVRDGDVTHGEYSLHEADGTIRTVKYTVDKHSGFNAVVERSGHATHAQPVAKAIVAAPTYNHHHHH